MQSLKKIHAWAQMQDPLSTKPQFSHYPRHLIGKQLAEISMRITCLSRDDRTLAKSV